MVIILVQSIYTMNKLTRSAHEFRVRFCECLLKINKTVWTACQRSLTFKMCNKMSTKQAGSLYTLKYGNCWRMLAEGKTETKIKNIKALCKLCTLKFLTLHVYIKCHNFLKPQNR